MVDLGGSGVFLVGCAPRSFERRLGRCRPMKFLIVALAMLGRRSEVADKAERVLGKRPGLGHLCRYWQTPRLKRCRPSEGIAHRHHAGDGKRQSRWHGCCITEFQNRHGFRGREAIVPHEAAGN